MKKFVLLAAAVAALAIPATGISASSRTSCSNMAYVNAESKVNLKASYAADLLQERLFSEAVSVLGQAVRQHSYTPVPCASELRSVRSTYGAGLRSWYLGAVAFRAGNMSSGLAMFQLGTARVKYATAQMKNYTATHY